MYCHQCGQKSVPGGVFCANCGTKVLVSDSAARVAGPPTQASPPPLPPIPRNTTEPPPLPSERNDAIGLTAQSPEATLTAARGSYGTNTKEVAIYAGFWKRAAAILIDGVVIIVASAMLGAVIGSGGAKAAKDAESVINFIVFFGQWIYFAGMESSMRGATLGKMALGIKVVDLDGNKISFGQATGRYFGKIISALTLGIGFLMAAFTQSKQTLHDKMASCLVVNKSATPAAISLLTGPRRLGKGMNALLILACCSVPVLGIFAAVAIPAYQDYTAKAELADSYVAATQGRDAVIAHYLNTKRWPDNLAITGFELKSPRVKKVLLDRSTGAILSFPADPKFKNGRIELTPSAVVTGKSQLVKLESFDWDKARQAGYSDKQILDGLNANGLLGFDLKAARTSGFADAEIASVLGKANPAPWDIPFADSPGSDISWSCRPVSIKTAWQSKSCREE
jgi:uncharacterized RDD family membrane protein YckC/Tfp pilus assembly major pilin PilA